ncbi:MAG: hypothetical protein JO057_19205 [Chloroflexi bacterium]|nr:hypothetical protein [Chloroflexota bacterium]
MKRLLMAAGGAAVLLGGALGVSYAQSAPAQTPTSTPTATQTAARTRHQAIISDAASQLGLSADQLQQALTQARKDAGGGAHPLADFRKDELQVAAKTLGFSDVKALRTALAGTTLTAYAQSHNVDPTTISNAMLADIKGRLPANANPNILTRAQNHINVLMTRTFKAGS